MTPVRDGEVATVVTTLEMTARPPPGPMPESSLRLVEWERPAPDEYRALFARVGAPWLWYSRLALADDRLLAIIRDPDISVFAAVDPEKGDVGFLELDFRQRSMCELSYFGLIPELAGQGHGRWLMAETLRRAWRPDIKRVWVHTCTLDHPSALGFYRARGFVAISRTIETFADPRLTGLLPPDSAPQIPLLAKRR